MRRQHHVIYVPGILDDIYFVQSTLVRFWRFYGVRGHTHEIPWAGPEAWEPKFEKLLERIDGYTAQDHTVSLVGASAGASAVLNAYAERRDSISGLAYICAKINTPDSVSSRTYAKNPAFKTSMELLQDNLKKLTPADKAKMRSFYSTGDKFVPRDANIIPDVRESRLPPLRHGRAILYSLSLGAPKLIRELKRAAK